MIRGVIRASRAQLMAGGSRSRSITIGERSSLGGCTDDARLLKRGQRPIFAFAIDAETPKRRQNSSTRRAFTRSAKNQSTTTTCKGLPGRPGGGGRVWDGVVLSMAPRYSGICYRTVRDEHAANKFPQSLDRAMSELLPIFGEWPSEIRIMLGFYREVITFHRF
jgi:hypothetical protein